MTQAEFFNHIIDGYLLHDLRNMADVQLREGEDKGGLGYPMLATIASGMELLGGVLQTDHIYEDHARNSRSYFNSYWNDYLVPTNTAYEPHADTFWALVRNGVAHTYIAKVGITVSKNLPEAHLQRHGNNLLNIDCTELYKDFVNSYLCIAKPKLESDPNLVQRIQLNIDALMAGSATRSSQFIAGDEMAATTAAVTTASGILSEHLTTNQTTTVIPDNLRSHE